MFLKGAEPKPGYSWFAWPVYCSPKDSPIACLILARFLKRRIHQYEIVFIPLATTLLAVCLYLLEIRQKSQGSIFVILSVFVGYLTGFVAFYALPLFANHGWERFLQLLEPPRNLKGWIVFVGSPLIMGCWFVSGLASVVVLFVLRRGPNRVVLASVGIAIGGALLLTSRFSLVGHYVRLLMGRVP